MSLAGYLRNSLLFRTVARHESILLLGRGALYVDTNDNRGRAILKSAGMTQPFTAMLWRRLVKIIDPELVLDVGANYGEIALSSTYGPRTQIHLFEPNPYVRAYLEKSISSRSDFKNFYLHPELVGSSSGRQAFMIDHKWSGTSSAVGRIFERDCIKGGGSEHFEEITVPSITIDESLVRSKITPGRRILFKIDVEGYEGQVILGMKRTLRDAAAYAGIIEFDRSYLKRAGTEPDELVGYLSEIGAIQGIAGNRIFDLTKQLPQHFDLLVASSPRVLHRCAQLGFARLLFRERY